MLIYRNIVFILLLLLFQGFFEQLGVPQNIFKYTVEALLLLSFFPFIKRIKLDKFKKSLLFIFSLYLITVLLSIVNNDNSIYLIYNYSRFTFYAIVIYLISQEIPYKPRITKKIFSFLVNINIIQVIAALINSSFLLIPLERKVGTMASSGGSLATVYTIFMAPFFLSQYLYSKKTRYLLYYLSTMIVGLASAKRAVAFFFIFISILTYLKIKKNKFNLFQISSFFIALVLVFNFSVLRVSFGNRVMNDNFGFVENISTALDYAYEYSSHLDDGGESTGRTSSMQKTISYFYNADLEEFIFGFGPKTLMGEMGFKKLEIMYGVVGWINEIICIGFIGLFLYLLVLFKLKNNARKIVFSKIDYYHNSLLIGVQMGYVTWLLTFFLYARTFQSSGIPLFILLFVHGYIAASKKIFKGNNFKKNI